MSTVILVIFGVAVVLGAAVMLLDLADAPEGYEDGQGFHLGREPEIRGALLLASPLSESRDDAADAAYATTQAQCPGARIAWASLDLRQRSS